MSNDATLKQTEKIFAEFQQLRTDQRNLAHKLSQIEMDLKEHKTVIETLKQVNDSRKCFRLIGGVLCERTVKDVLPQLIDNRDNLDKTIEVVAEQLAKKGLELNKYKEENNIRIRGQEAIIDNSDKSGGDVNTLEKSEENRTVLVSN